jgi:hypothetical protein
MGDNAAPQQNPPQQGSFILNDDRIKRMVEDFLIRGGFYTRNNTGQIQPTNFAGHIPTDITPTIIYDVAGTGERIPLEEIRNLLDVLDERARQIITDPDRYLLNFNRNNEVNAAVGQFTADQHANYDSMIRYLTGQGMTAKFRAGSEAATREATRTLPIVAALATIITLAQTVPEINANELEYLYGALVVLPIIQYNIREQAPRNNVVRVNYVLLLRELNARLEDLNQYRSQRILNPQYSCLLTSMGTAVVSIFTCCCCSSGLSIAAPSTCGGLFLLTQCILRLDLNSRIKDTQGYIRSAENGAEEQRARRAQEQEQTERNTNVFNRMQQLHTEHPAIQQNFNANNIQAFGQPTNLLFTRNGEPHIMDFEHIMNTHIAAVQTMGQQIGLINAAGVSDPNNASSSSSQSNNNNNNNAGGLDTRQYSAASASNNNNTNSNNSTQSPNPPPYTQGDDNDDDVDHDDADDDVTPVVTHESPHMK